jgi:hypothetical protein
MKSDRHMRLVRLEQIAEPRGCECRYWGPCVFLMPGEQPRPEWCPTCGRHAPIQLERHYLIVPAEETAGAA